MEMTNKFLLYDLNNGGFVRGNGSVADNNIENAAMFDADTAKSTVNSVDEASYLQVPLTADFVQGLPFDMEDTAPGTAHSEVMDTDAAKQGDFIVLTSLGFYDEKYNSMTNTSRPKIRGFEMDYANLYNADKLKEMGTEYITERMYDMGSNEQPLIVPVSEMQQEKLRALPPFAEDKGFFFEPIGDTQKTEREEMPDLGTALDDLQADQAAVELPWEM